MLNKRSKSLVWISLGVLIVSLFLNCYVYGSRYDESFGAPNSGSTTTFRC